jgi:hypothetical protein
MWLNAFVCDCDVPGCTGMYRDVPVCTGGTWYPGTAGTRINLDTKILLKNNFAKTKRGNP